MRFIVDERVLIPRPETEELVEWLIYDLKKENKENPRIIDVGTGSGCIPIAIKKNHKHATVTGIDISTDAIDLAKQNAIANDVEVDFLCVDFLNPSEMLSLANYDLIISNPPYIPERESSMLSTNVIAYEPHLALFVPDGDPLIFYKKIAEFAVKNLNGDGKIYLEVHQDYAHDVAAIFYEPSFTDIIIKKDLYNNARMVRITKAE